MPVLALLMAAAPVAGAALPACRPAQLRLSTDDRGGDFNGMSHSGIELSLRNLGRACRLPALPRVTMLDRRGRALAARRDPPVVGMHPGPAMLPVRLGAGRRATIDLRWVSGAVFDGNRSVNAAMVAVRIGAGLVRAPLGARLYGPARGGVTFEQTPARVAEGMPAG